MQRDYDELAARFDSTPPKSNGRAAETSEASVTLTNASDVKVVPIRWLWDGWLARGKLEILAGPPGLGKTTIALSLASVVTSGRAVARRDAMP